jgi:hypothetical protein
MRINISLKTGKTKKIEKTYVVVLWGKWEGKLEMEIQMKQDQKVCVGECIFIFLVCVLSILLIL